MIEWSWCNIVIMLTFLQYCAWKCSYCSIVCMNITLHILPEVKNWNYLVPQYQQLCLLSNCWCNSLPIHLEKDISHPLTSLISIPLFFPCDPFPSLPTHCNSCITYASLFIPPSPTFPITSLYILQNSVLSQFSMGSLRNALTFQLLAYLKKEEEKKNSHLDSQARTHTHIHAHRHICTYMHTLSCFSDLRYYWYVHKHLK